jgi:hypothetical protein
MRWEVTMLLSGHGKYCICQQCLRAAAADLIDNYKLISAMKLIVDDLHGMTRREGGTLGAIFNTTDFLYLLTQKRLTIVPRFPTIAMRHAYLAGWFKDFVERYQAMIKVVEEDKSGSFTMRTREQIKRSMEEYET